MTGLQMVKIVGKVSCLKIQTIIKDNKRIKDKVTEDYMNQIEYNKKKEITEWFSVIK